MSVQADGEPPLLRWYPFKDLAPEMLSSISSAWPAPSMLFGAADGARRPSEYSDGLPAALTTRRGET